MEADTAKTKAKPKKERIEHALPEVTAREATAGETPKVAADLAKLAVEAGWEALVTYARGTTDSDNPKLTHSIAVRMRRGAQAAAAVWMSPVELKVVKSKKKVPTGEVELVTVTRKRKGEAVEVQVEKPVMVEVEVESLEQVWGFDFAARAGRWLCRKTGMSGFIPVKLSNTALKEYLRTPIPVANCSLPADIWSAGAGDLDPEMLEGLTRLASLFAGGESESAQPLPNE